MESISKLRRQTSRAKQLVLLLVALVLPAMVFELFFDTYDLLLFFNTTALITSLLFVLRYSAVVWERTQTGIVTMGISVCVLLIATGGLMRNLTTVSVEHTYDLILFLAYYGVSIVMPWRLMLVNKAQQELHEDKDRNAS